MTYSLGASKELKKIVFIAVLGILASTSAFAIPTCVSLNDPTFTTGTYDPDTGASPWTGTSCTVGSETFSNFAVYGQAYGEGIGIQLTFTVVGSALQIGGTNLGTNDIEIYFTITNGVNAIGLSGGPGENVTEEVCGVAFDQSHGSENCSSPLNQSSLAIVGGSPSQVTSLVTLAPVDFVVKDDSGGSQVTQTVLPEPATFSLLGLGLLGLGLAGRRLRK